MTEDIAWQLKQAIQRHQRLSNVKLAKLLGIRKSYVRKLKKKLDL
jgi:hypothetical protein